MKVVRPYAPAAFTPRKYSWYSFLLEPEEEINYILLFHIYNNYNNYTTPHN